MNRCTILAFSFLLLCAAGDSAADQPLASALGLSTEQARKVNVVEARYRKQFASQRQGFNRDSRALRRARLANDGAETVRLEQVTEQQRQGLIDLRQQWDDEIRRQLSGQQLSAFDAHIERRRRMAGSSRDERLFER